MIGCTASPRKGNQVALLRTGVILRILCGSSSARVFFFFFTNNPYGFIWQTSTTQLQPST